MKVFMVFAFKEAEFIFGLNVCVCLFNLTIIVKLNTCF